MLNNNKLYESIIKDVAKIIKLNLLNEGKYDNVDHSHNNKFNFTTNRVMMHYNGLGIYATHLSLNKQELDHTAADILMKNIYNSTNVGLKLVYRKSSSKHNYCLQIIDNDINIFDDDKITHIAFMNELEKPNKFKVYIL